jgi:hypothetical protein
MGVGPCWAPPLCALSVRYEAAVEEVEVVVEDAEVEEEERAAEDLEGAAGRAEVKESRRAGRALEAAFRAAARVACGCTVLDVDREESVDWLRPESLAGFVSWLFGL